MNIYDIAKEANVSVATVSRVMNHKQNISPETRRKVESVLKKYNYTPSSIARGLAFRSMSMIGLVMQDIRNIHYTNTAYVVEQELRQKGFCCIFCNTDDPDPTEAFKMLRDFRVDGIILIGSVFMNAQTRKAIESYHPDTHIIFVNGILPRDNVCSIQCDEYCGAKLMVEHMVRRGHDRILFVTDADTNSALRKQQGYKEAVEALCTEAPRTFHTEKEGFDGGYETTMALLQQNIDFNAVIYSDDVVAMGGLRALDECRISIPGQVAVGGFDHAWGGKIGSYALTSVDSQLGLMGAEAARILCDLVAGAEHPAPVTLMPSIFQGTTT